MAPIYDLIPKPENALQLYEPDSRTLYTIEATARLTGLQRRTIMVYYKRGLVTPVSRAEGGGFRFNREGIRALRRIEQLRSTLGMNTEGIKMMLGLMNEVERLRAEVRHLRG